jgi:hypothetical protein
MDGDLWRRITEKVNRTSSSLSGWERARVRATV